MKWFFRIFFKTVRIILGPFVLFYEKVTRPRAIQRHPESQEKIDFETSKYTLFQYRTCPFCLKVRHTIHRLSLNIHHCDAQHNQDCKKHLMEVGGKVQVPCLKIHKDDGNHVWLYDSNKIIQYLQEQYAE